MTGRPNISSSAVSPMTGNPTMMPSSWFIPMSGHKNITTLLPFPIWLYPTSTSVGWIANCIPGGACGKIELYTYMLCLSNKLNENQNRNKNYFFHISRFLVQTEVWRKGLNVKCLPAVAGKTDECKM
jgi:hypothetical protein